jgi:hypothetical protein
MSEDIRKMIDKVKNFGQFLNEQKETVTIANIRYAEELNIKYLTIRHRLNSKKFINYVYIYDINIIDELKEKYISQESI